MEETKIEKLEEPQPVLVPEINYEKLADMIVEKTAKKEAPKVELAEKKTVQKASNTNENKELLLQRQFPTLTDRAIKHLVLMKDNRKFIATEDGITVEKVEEKW